MCLYRLIGVLAIVNPPAAIPIFLSLCNESYACTIPTNSTNKCVCRLNEPFGSGFHLPAEWHPQSCVLIAWPSSDSDFSTNLTEVETSYRLIAEAISRRQKLLIACQNQHEQQHVQKYLNHLPHAQQIDYAILPFDDIWVRDTAPLSLLSDQGIQLINFSFNGWGEKYPHQADTAFAQNLYQHCLSQTKQFAITQMQTLEMVLEGGSIDSDGAGTLLTTRTCLLNPNRNPRLNQQQIESLLLTQLGIKRIHWLNYGSIEGDDTDAHIDTLARFCSTDTIAYSSCDDVDDIHYVSLKQMEKELQSFTTRQGHLYRLLPLPIPKPIFNTLGQRLPANYANFLIINHAVLMPTYNDPADSIALKQIAQAFPSREIIAIPSLSLIQQFGSLHCMSMQFPALLTL